MAEDSITVSEAAADSSVRFAVVLRGYDRHQVDEYVQALQERVARFAEGGVPQPRPPAEPAASGVGARIEKILGLAEAEAAAIRAAAEEDAEKIRADARSAVADAEDVRRTAEAEAQREARLIVARAEEEAAEVRALHRELSDDLDRIAEAIAALRGPADGREPEASTDDAEENGEPIAPKPARRVTRRGGAAERRAGPA
ncbi:hypothetical protein Amsp01_050570 [Amycolatopsis sp. NBRC 101858]|uniref:DivIVA domain-containing protein n=1 Tax=Amycolatopsis sp. NBRC 101858 TaxID=3032200 RepID=UPI0024A16997|nr:DivIVA domain-containing protein [Amycolatopsis sp. NBRC 101858]GLY39033.1 hypothetical protein Amsp01_050570 [Amycolatopsis sp. NBRC 101858]